MEANEFFLPTNVAILQNRPYFRDCRTYHKREVYLLSVIFQWIQARPTLFTQINFDHFEVRDTGFATGKTESSQEFFVYELHGDIALMNSHYAYFVIRKLKDLSEGSYSCVAVSSPKLGPADLSWLKDRNNWLVWKL